MSFGEDSGAPAKEEESLVFSKVENLDPSSRRVNLTVKAVSKTPPREIVSRNDGSTHRVADALVGDETGCVLMTLWDDNIDKLNESDVVAIKNAYVSLFRGSMRLNTGRYGSFEHTDQSIGDVKTDNNLSDKQYEQERRFPSFRPYYQGGRDDRGRGRGGGRGYGRGRRY
ncbi:MAG: single-stranded DNA-binding protein [Candidatus Bathyarchaeia archaeon]